MDETTDNTEKKPFRVRRLASLSAIRKEIVRVYEEARTAGPAGAIQYYRALAFILNTAATVRKDEALADIERRLGELEREGKKC